MNLKQEIANYWNTQPCNIKHGKSTYGTKEFFNEISERRYYVEPHIPIFAGFSDTKNKQVLEIGCGIGTDAIEFCKNGAKYTGTDVSDVSLNITDDRMKLYNFDATLKKTDLNEVPLEWIEKFDLVYSFGVLHHDPDIQKIIDNIHSLVKPGGTFKFMVYAKHSWKNAMIKSGFDQYEAQSNCPWATTYDKEDIIELLKNKWISVSIKQDHCFMYNVHEYKKGNYVLEKWFESMPSEMRETIKKELGWHMLVTCIKEK